MYGVLHMRIKEKIYMNRSQLMEEGPIIIAAIGDSVTHAAEMHPDVAFHGRLRHKIIDVRNYVPVTVINSGIGGTCAGDALSRVDNVLAHKPDVTIICFGLNDVNNELHEFITPLRELFEKCLKVSDVIFMTPNMLNTYVAPGTAPHNLEYAAITAEMQNSGKMDTFMNAACDLAREMGVTVCDCYGMWKERAKTEDTTLLLANRINHPTEEMHELFADALFKTIFGEDELEKKENDNTMYVRK